MEHIVKGDVVILPFPFSDLTAIKKRPALVAATLMGEDIILLQITSSHRKDEYSIPLHTEEFECGTLPVNSLIRFNKIFTADKAIITSIAGRITKNKIREVEQHIVQLFTI